MSVFPVLCRFAVFNILSTKDTMKCDLYEGRELLENILDTVDACNQQFDHGYRSFVYNYLS